MTSLANMKLHFPQFATYFDAPNAHAAIKKMKKSEKVELYKAAVKNEASRKDPELIAFKNVVKEALKKHEQKGKLSHDKIAKFHKWKNKDRELQKAIQTVLPLPQKTEVEAPKVAAPVESEAEKQAKRLLNLAIEHIATRLTLRPAASAAPDAPPLTEKEQFASIALDHLETMRQALTEGERPFFTADTLSEMDGASYQAMLDCTLLKILQTAIGQNLTPLSALSTLQILGANGTLTLSQAADFDGIFQQLVDLKTRLQSIPSEEYGQLLKKITDTDEKTALKPAAQALFKAIGQFRTILEQNLITNRRFLTAFTG